ncbi:SDR family oxidoreductase [Halocatena halophila]|uniref:SDR family oxidoreductase n=1 Tax=Halocatena halophila TaxID=2814576 RepID=UPI002ED0A499
MTESNENQPNVNNSSQSTSPDHLDGDVAIITGASRGIGRATAERLAADGATVIINYHSNEEAAMAVRNSIETIDGDAIIVQGDIRKEGDVKRLFEAAEREFGSVDIVVNAAAPPTIYKPLAEFTEAEFDRMFDVHAKGTFFILREAANRITTGGRIVNFSTSGTNMRGPEGGPYNASKAAGEQLVSALAAELGDRDIRVNSISPGLTDTDGVVIDDAAIDTLVQQTPLDRPGHPEDIADVVAFLVSDDARWITSHDLLATGGLS